MNNFNISTIEIAMKDAIKAWGVSQVVYNNRPKSATQVRDFVVVRVSGQVRDLDVFGECTLAVSLFAKDDDNLKNDVKLGYMYDKLVAALPFGFTAEKDGAVKAEYLFDRPNTLADVPDDYGYHARTLLINAIIKSI